MKKIITHGVHEVAEHYSDFTGERSHGKLTIQAGYGSSYDPSYYEFDVDDVDIRYLLTILQLRLPDGKNVNSPPFLSL